jgi:5-(carboxyamino)imidazole ribonucleotide mutase
MTSAAPRVGILMGSDSDWDVMAAAAARLDAFGVPYEVTVTSAHRAATANTPARAPRRRL